jgi:phage shock protein A
MLNFFKRLFGIGKTKETTPAPIDKQTAPEKMTTQEIKILQAELDSEIKKLAETKAIAIRIKRDIENDKQLLEAEQLPAETILRRAEILKRYEENLAKKQKYDETVSRMETRIRELKTPISAWEKEAKTVGMISVRGMISIDSSSTVNMLDKMKAKIAEKESAEKALDAPSTSDEMTLDELKRKMDMNTPEADKPESKDKPDE